MEDKIKRLELDIQKLKKQAVDKDSLLKEHEDTIETLKINLENEQLEKDNYMKSKNDLTQALEDQEKDFEEAKEQLIRETSERIWAELTKKMDEEVKWLKGTIDEWEEELW